jgi:hypothetical protein
MSTAGGFFADAIAASDETDSVQKTAHATVVVRPQHRVEFDLAKWQALGRIVYVSSGASAFGIRMIDSDSKTVFRFAGADLHPTVIVELAENKPVDGVAALFDRDENVKLDVYLLNQLPKGLANLSHEDSIKCSIDFGELARAGSDFAATTARYVVFRWTRAKPTKSPFCVAELSAFSGVRPNDIPPTLADNGIHFASETNVDISNKLGTLADPPSVKVVSP